MTSYDTYYEEEKDYFGDAYKWFVDFFAKNKLWKTVLDLGCGQGRDALVLWRLWYTVMWIDNSKIWIDQLINNAKKEKLDISWTVWDIYNCNLISEYDIVLLDSMFHFYKNDMEKEMNFLDDILLNIKKWWVVCIMILKSNINEKIITWLLSKNNFLKIEDKYIDYEKFNCKYRMFVYKNKKD